MSTAAVNTKKAIDSLLNKFKAGELNEKALMDALAPLANTAKETKTPGRSKRQPLPR